MSQTVDIETRLPICKVDAAQRLLTAVVLEPWDGDPETAEDSEDTQGDVITAEEIEAAMVDYMKDPETFLGFMHGDDPAPLVLIENWIARQELTLGDETVKAGSWLMTMYVDDDELWAAVESGELDGLSIRVDGLRTEV